LYSEVSAGINCYSTSSVVENWLTSGKTSGQNCNISAIETSSVGLVLLSDISKKIPYSILRFAFCILSSEEKVFGLEELP
jgi:hypothetical protein